MEIKVIGPQIEEENETYGRIVIAPLERGYGHTIGTALRRVLLSSIEGAAIVSCTIRGATHELSTIKGVKEEVIYILQNLKKIRFKLYSDGPETLELHVKGKEKEVVLAGDFKPNPNVDIITKEQIIATLSKDGELDMKVEVRKGKGYVLAQKNKRPEYGRDVLVLDSLFSPIQKVNYRVENISMGGRTGYEKLILEIYTDGSIKPSESFAYATKLLRDMFDMLLRPEKEVIKPAEEVIKEEKIQEYLTQPIEVLQLPTRAYNCLLEADIRTIGDLINKTEKELLSIRNFGESSLAEVKERLKTRGLSLRESS